MSHLCRRRRRRRRYLLPSILLHEIALLTCDLVFSPFSHNLFLIFISITLKHT